MTLVTGTVQDLGYDGMEGTLWARPARFRSDGQVVYAPERKPYKVVDGVVSADLAPGPAVLELQVGSHARGTFEVVIPDADTTLADLLDTVFPWEPAQVSLFVAEREAAEQAKADAEQAATLAGTAKTGAELAAQQTGQDRTAVAADKDTVVAHVQALAEPNDAAVLGLISEGADTQTKAALNATYVPNGKLLTYAGDYPSVQDAINAATPGTTILVGDGIFNEQSLTVTTPGLRLQGKGPSATEIKVAVGDALTLSSTLNLAHIEICDMTITSDIGGGHVVNVPFGINQSVFRRVHLKQRNPGKSILHCVRDTTNGGLFDNKFTDCYFNMPSNSTVPGFYIKGAGNPASANLWHRCRVQGGGTYLFHLEAGPGNYCYTNTFAVLNFEIANNGGIRILGGLNTSISEVGFFDNGTITADLIYIGRAAGANQSRGTAIRSLHRSGGTLSGGAVDVKFASGENNGSNTIDTISAPSAAGMVIDVGNNSGYVAVFSYDPGNMSILNVNPDRTVLVAAQEGIRTPKLTLGTGLLLNGAGTPEGSVTAPQGSVYLSRGGGSGNTMFVKETGTGNTGWTAVRGIATASSGALGAAANAVNTTGKATGQRIWNTTTNRPVWATGSAATSPWVHADGTTAHTPA